MERERYAYGSYPDPNLWAYEILLSLGQVWFVRFRYDGDFKLDIPVVHLQKHDLAVLCRYHGMWTCLKIATDELKERGLIS